MRLQRLGVGEPGELARVPIGSDHQMTRGVREPVQEDERGLAPVHDQHLLVLACGRPAEDAAVQLVGLPDVLEPPGRPQLPGHLPASTRSAGFRRRGRPARPPLRLARYPPDFGRSSQRLQWKNWRRGEPQGEPLRTVRLRPTAGRASTAPVKMLRDHDLRVAGRRRDKAARRWAGPQSAVSGIPPHSERDEVKTATGRGKRLRIPANVWLTGNSVDPSHQPLRRSARTPPAATTTRPNATPPSSAEPGGRPGALSAPLAMAESD